MNEVLNTIKAYLKGVRGEWGKITWPEKQQVVSETLFVTVIIIVFTVSVYIMDIFYKWILGFIPHR